MRRMMTAVVATTAMAGGCGPSVVVQGFGAVTAPLCTVDDSSLALARGTLDVGAATRYQGFMKARTARDATVSVVEAEIAFTLDLSSSESELFAAAAAQVGTGGYLECDGETCRTSVPYLAPAVTTELGLVDDERVLLVSTDLIIDDVGQTIAAVVETARELDQVGGPELDAITATLDVTLIDSGGGRSLPTTFVVDICRGCLAPTEPICREQNATPVALPAETCLPGQDIATSTCVCDDGSRVPEGGCS